MTRGEQEGEREPQRLEAFSDGVLAVIITIMVLDLKQPKGDTFRLFEKNSLPGILVYLLSFTFIGIYWNNHHHLLRATQRISGAVMWANLHLLFWLSLVPFLTSWVGDSYQAHLPASLYGVLGFLSGAAYTMLTIAIVRSDGPDSKVARGVGQDFKGKVSLALYALGVGLAWVSPWISYALYAMVSVIWFVPDRRLDHRPAGVDPA